MLFELDGEPVFATTGGRAHEAAQPLMVFLHGAGMDHSVFALQSRGFAHQGWRVLAVDFPGHGGSGGPVLADIAAMAQWTAGLVAAQGGRATLVGHSMGALVALATAAHFPEQVAGIGLIGVGEKMPVHPDLLAAAKSGHPDALDMVSIWGLGGAATRGGSPSPGQWMLGGAERLLARAAPGVLHAGLAACNAYTQAVADASKIACRAVLVLGERDVMTPAKSGLALGARIAGARVTVVPGAGHMLPIERPTETARALEGLAG